MLIERRWVPDRPSVPLPSSTEATIDIDVFARCLRRFCWLILTVEYTFAGGAVFIGAKIEAPHSSESIMDTWRKVGTIAAALLAAAGVGIAAISSMPAQFTVEPAPVTGAEVQALMLRSGFEPEALAAVGLSAADATAIFEQFSLFVQSSPAVTAGIREAILASRSERTAAVQAARVQQAGLVTETAPVTTARATEGLTAVLDEATAFAASRLTRAQLANLRALRDRAAWEVPVHVKLTERTEAEWVALRDAYAARAVAQSRNEAPSPQALRIIERAEADPAARIARANVQANAAAIEDVMRALSR